ncbi:MAG: cellulase family glycosylhydrolase [Clostridia bacterium]|nr:cellulase family glycosylhydrolase [Clostridia bacterium]
MRLKYLLVMLMTAALLFAACGKAEEVYPGITASEAGESEAGTQEETQEENEEIAMVRSSYFEFDFPGPADCNPDRIGLHVGEEGVITLAGKPFSGFGVNYFGAFAHYWYGEYDDQPFVEAFRKLKEYGVDFIRMPFGGYWTDYYEAFSRDPDGVLSYLDRVVEAAEQARIGIIASLFWHDTALPQYLGEHRSAMGDPESGTVGYARDYAAAVVSRYAGSRAVWAWEIGNEYNLSADLCDTVDWNWLSAYPEEEPSGFDYYSSEELCVFYRQIADVIRQYDGWRMIETGNGEMRPFAFASANASKRMKKETHSWTVDWTLNTREEFDEMNGRMTPDPLDCVCFHLQHGTGDGSAAYVETVKPWGKSISKREYFTAYKEAADRLGKGCIFGEMGDFLDMNGAPDLEEHFRSLIDDIRASGIQIALTWQFQDFTDAGNDGMKLRVLGEANRQFAEEGLYPVDEAWK